MHFGREAGVYVLNTWVKTHGAPGGMDLARASSPMHEQVSDEQDVQEIEERTSDDEEEDHDVLHGIDECVTRD